MCGLIGAYFYSLRISKKSILVAECSALAIHHGSASIEYSKIVNNLSHATKEFSEFNYKLWVDWAREIEGKDNYQLGGNNPRPLRHVLSNASEMLANYGSNNNFRGMSASRSILSVLRNGVDNFNDTEYQKLLKKADGKYQDFEEIFGLPSKSASITSALAFRWACSQLIKRVSREDWKGIWESAWLEDGWLTNYKVEFLKIKPVLNDARELLKSEKAKLAHSVFPLDSNIDLFKKYSETLRIIDNLLEGCDSNILEVYQDWKFDEEMSQLVVCSMAIAFFAMSQLDTVYMGRNE